uniref:J domain-containing protein n=1 Tax=viral metagenome TaxID=1070528 RepID=A0A6C0LFG8_9ZZZZ
MELSDYDLLGITTKATFRIVKNAYYELSRIYHPDSSQIIIGMTKKEREIAFQRIQTAYENIKEKMNVVEVDLPESEIEYQVDHVIKKTNEIDINDENFHEKFNTEFEKVNTFENNDNPYSIHYKVPEESKRNLQDSQIILKESGSIKSSNIFEFGMNYIEDHSTDKYYDFNKLQSGKSEALESNDSNLVNSLNFKEIIDDNLNKKLEELVNKRNESLDLTDSEIEFVKRQKRVQKEIEESKSKVQNRRNQGLLF